MDSRKAIELLLAYALKPGDQDAHAKFNAVLITAGSLYDKLLISEPDFDKEITESAYRDPDDPWKGTPLSLAKSTQASPDVAAARNEMLKWVMDTLEQDRELQRNKPVFMDRVIQGLPVAGVAKKYNISPSEVTKRTQAVQKRLRELAVKQELFP